MYVETETCRDWAKDVETETPLRLSLISEGGMNLMIWQYLEHLISGALNVFGCSDCHGEGDMRVKKLRGGVG